MLISIFLVDSPLKAVRSIAGAGEGGSEIQSYHQSKSSLATIVWHIVVLLWAPLRSTVRVALLIHMPPFNRLHMCLASSYFLLSITTSGNMVK